MRLLVEHGASLRLGDSILSRLSLEKSPSFVEKFSPILDDLVALGLDIDETSYDGTTFLLKIVEELDSKEIVQ